MKPASTFVNIPLDAAFMSGAIFSQIHLAGRRMESQSSPPVTTILLIDDDDNDRAYYAERIRIGIPDCTILESRDGRSGLELYRARKIDCIVTELVLPDMSGFEFLLEVVPRRSKPAIAVVFLTRALWKSLQDLAIRNGAQAYLRKHFTSGDELTQIIPKAIARVGATGKHRQQSLSL